MSLFLDASLAVVLADYVGTDPSGKFSLIGGGLNVLGVGPDGNTAPHYLAAWVELPGRYAGVQFSISLSLWDEDTGSVVQVPRGPGLAPEALRIQQLAVAQRIYIDGVPVPEETSVRAHFAIGFMTGLPLVPGHRYSWRAEIDGQRKKGWRTDYYLLPLPQPPIVGGPAGPADIAGHTTDEIDDEIVD